jgi:carbon-monoxide dehydrogenase medium subunit
MSAIDYFEPETVEAAVELLAGREDARCLAGGQTLVAMMNAGLLETKSLVSLRRVRGLDEIRRDEDGSLWIGAMVRHAAVARESRLDGRLNVVRGAASVIAHPAIRNMGTLGGAMGHADPSSDYPAAVVAAGAEIEVAGPHGRRMVPAGEFFAGYLTTTLEPGELVTGVRLPHGPAGAVGVYEKFARVDGDYATVSVALVMERHGGRCASVRIALGACAMAPVRVERAEEYLVGSELDEQSVDAACAELVDACDPIDDVRGSAAYRLELVPRLVRRALARATGLPERSA